MYEMTGKVPCQGDGAHLWQFFKTSACSLKSLWIELKDGPQHGRRQIIEDENVHWDNITITTTGAEIYRDQEGGRKIASVDFDTTISTVQGTFSITAPKGGFFHVMGEINSYHTPILVGTEIHSGLVVIGTWGDLRDMLERYGLKVTSN